jgi:hypothetical protein
MSTNNSDFESETKIKENSDTSILSESSENLTDYSSETSSFKRKTFETKYPKFTKSKSFINKKPESIINTVNEEQNEDENEPEKKIRIKKKKYESEGDMLDMAISRFGKLKFTKSFHETNMMDTLYEVKEEQCNEGQEETKAKIKLQSPQMKFLTDCVEDNQYRPAFFSSQQVSSFKGFDYDQDVITEDQSENNCENPVMTRKNTSNKKLENFIDKSEAYDEPLGMKKALTENIIIESIKEENAEEEDKEESSLAASTAVFNHNHNNSFPKSDELEETINSCKLKYRLSVKGAGAQFEENKVIKESEEDGQNDA